MTLEVFNEPWHYFGARGEGEGGEGRGGGEMRRGGGGSERRDGEGGRCAAIQGATRAATPSRCHTATDTPPPFLTHTSAHTLACIHTDCHVTPSCLPSPPPSPLWTLCYETVWKGSDTNISFVHTGGSLSSLT